MFDNRYGTPRAPVEAALSAGQDVLFDIDWQGTQQLREKARADVVSVFILPPSAADLEKRLHTRAQDSDEVIRGRMSRASHELSHWAEYDYIVINHNVDDAFAEVQSILKAERLKRERRSGLPEFVRGCSASSKNNRCCLLVLRAARQPRQQFRHPPLRVVGCALIARGVSRSLATLQRSVLVRNYRRGRVIQYRSESQLMRRLPRRSRVFCSCAA